MQPLLNMYQTVNSYYQDDADFLSMQAFLYAHVNRHDEAKSLIDRSLAFEPHNAWTQHVYIHTLNENNLAEIETAIEFLELRSNDWPKQNRFFEGHNWMHLCILHLNKDRLLGRSPSTTAALIIDNYIKHIWGEAKSYNFEQNNAFLTLWSLELAGFAEQIPEKLWQDLANYAEPFMDDYFTPYLTVTAILAVAKVATTKAEAAFARFATYASSHPLNSKKRYAWYEIGLPVLEGCLAYLKKDYASAVRLLAPVHDKTRPLGHSDEQRAIFTATYMHAKHLVLSC
jgi:tetratricopeptide (TPR) repeat protein